MRTEIENAAAAIDPPEQYLTVHGDDGRPFAKFISRAWVEWCARRNINPFHRDRERVSNEMRRAVIERDRGICGICQGVIAEGSRIHVDHIRPVSKGGPMVVGNLQATHADCNLRKSDKWEK